MEAFYASMPADIMFGKVTSTDPLKIYVEQRFPLEAQDLTLSSLVRDFEVELELNGEKKTYKACLALKPGEKVTLIRAQGGQKFIVLDRVV